MRWMPIASHLASTASLIATVDDMQQAHPELGCMVRAIKRSTFADALVMAIWRRGKPDALLHHSDQGSQYGRAVHLPAIAGRCPAGPARPLTAEDSGRIGRVCVLPGARALAPR